MSIKLSKIGFFFLILFTPLAFGTTEPWSMAVMECTTVLSVFLFLIHIIRTKKTLYKIPGLTPLCLFLGYIVLQMIPLPPVAVAWLSPQAYDVHTTAQHLSGSDSWITLSLNQKATLSQFFRYAAYVLFYILTVQLLREKSILKAIAITIVSFGGLLALSSILQFYLTDDMALWFRHVPENSIVMGPYANHNHYAGLMEMIFPIVLGLFLFYRPRFSGSSLFRGIAEMMNQEKANIHILIGTAALLIVTSIFVSLSRGAMISTFLSLILFTVLLLKRKISKGNTLLILGIIMLTALSISWFGWDQIFERFAKLKNAQGIIYESRLDFWKDTLEMIRHFPVTGSGIGTFSLVYPLHRTIVSSLFLTHAHNDYLELLAEAGFIGFILVACFLISFFYQTFSVFLKRRDAFSIYLYMGCITGMASILFHSMTDFNMHIGANGLWFFFIAGLAVSAVNTGMRKGRRETRLDPYQISGHRTGSFLVIIILAICTIGYNLSSLLGAFYYNNVNQSLVTAESRIETLKKIEKIAGYARKFDPFEAEYPFLSANTTWFLNRPDQSENHLKSAITLSPLNSRYLNRFGLFLSKSGDSQKAGIALERAMIYDKSDPEYAFQYGVWLLATQQAPKSIEIMSRVLRLNEKYLGRVLTSMIVNGAEPGHIEQTIPESPGAAIAYSQFLFDTGNTVEAIDKFLESLDLIEKMPPDGSNLLKDHRRKIKSYYFKIYTFFIRHKDFRNATHVMNRAEKKLPMDANVKVALADMYFNQGIIYKALEKYDHALLLDPENKRALEMVKEISP